MSRRPPSMTRAGGFRAARIAGIEVRVDATWLISLALLTPTIGRYVGEQIAPGASTARAWTLAVAVAVVITLCIVAHEMAHSLVARAHGLPVRGITLFAFGGVSQIDREAPTPAAEYRVAMAGPLLSIALAATFAVVARAGAPEATGLPGPWGSLALVNLWLALFNMIPAFPMDGGRILRSALWAAVRSRARATRWAALAGRAFGAGVIAVGSVALLVSALSQSEGAVYYVWPMLIGLFVYNAAKAAGEAEGGERPNERPPVP